MSEAYQWFATYAVYGCLFQVPALPRVHLLTTIFCPVVNDRSQLAFIASVRVSRQGYVVVVNQPTLSTSNFLLLSVRRTSCIRFADNEFSTSLDPQAGRLRLNPNFYESLLSCFAYDRSVGLMGRTVSIQKDKLCDVTSCFKSRSRETVCSSPPATVISADPPTPVCRADNSDPFLSDLSSGLSSSQMSSIASFSSMSARRSDPSLFGSPSAASDLDEPCVREADLDEPCVREADLDEPCVREADLDEPCVREADGNGGVSQGSDVDGVSDRISVGPFDEEEKAVMDSTTSTTGRT